MSILTRDDGVQFVMQAYRELLTYKKKSLASQRTRDIAAQQGQFVRLFKKEAGQYEAVFSRDPGYLLGESVKHYFNEIQNLIFCESLSNTSDLLVVVIRTGSVYLDAIIPIKNLRHELLPLLTSPQGYQVITSGYVPLKENGLHFPKELLSALETLDEPLLSRLPTLRTLQLLPLPLALRTERLTHRTLPIATMAVLILMVVSGIWSLFPKPHATPPITTQAAIDPYDDYYRALSTPSPNQQLAELTQTINRLYALPGWTVTTIHFDGLQYQMTVSSEGGNLESLRTWAKQHEFHYLLTPDAAILTLFSQASKRTKPKVIYPSQDIVTLLIDKLDILLQGKHITLQKITQRGKAHETSMAILLKDASPQLLTFIGQALQDLPVAIHDAHFRITPGILNGIINLSVWGT